MPVMDVLLWFGATCIHEVVNVILVLILILILVILISFTTCSLRPKQVQFMTRPRCIIITIGPTSKLT